MLIIVICLLMASKSLSLKPTLNMLTFPLNFVLEVYLNGFSYTESKIIKEKCV